ncbi:MAG: protein-ADP-ribose hydrolase, partial [Clostridiales bacterium]|nr:protein-ADP-ribose hydrolase [Clostridiales bacterium]
MNQEERRIKLIKMLLDENPEYQAIGIPDSVDEQRRLLRSLMNVRSPGAIDEDFIKIQDEYLTSATSEKGITDISDLPEVEDGIYLWQGDITTLKCDAIVNAANSGMTGCYAP